MPWSHRHFRSAVVAFVGATLCASAAGACLVAAWWVVFQARIGPVVATFTGSHGLHTGDIIGVAYAVVGFGLIVWATSLWEDGARRLRRISASRRYANVA